MGTSIPPGPPFVCYDCHNEFPTAKAVAWAEAEDRPFDGTSLLVAVAFRKLEFLPEEPYMDKLVPLCRDCLVARLITLAHKISRRRRDT